MANLGRPFRAVAAWFRGFFRPREEWVEPSNEITRAVLSGITLRLPELPALETAFAAWTEPGAASPEPSNEAPTAAPAPPLSPEPEVTVGDKPGESPRRWEAA